jgi:nicotinamidase-related amidase
MAKPFASHPNTIARDTAALLISDLQEAFQPVIHEFDRIVARTAIVIRGAALLRIPILVTEQNPQKLGATVAGIKEVLPDWVQIVDKTAFSACGASVFRMQLGGLPFARGQVLICGIETHICVNQSVHDLLAMGHQVHVLEDCVSSRTPEHRAIGLAKMYRSGALPGSSEMALFEMMRDAKHEQFREISKLVK